MRRLVSNARSALVPTLSKRLTRTGLVGALRVPSCYPKSNGDIHLH